MNLWIWCKTCEPLWFWVWQNENTWYQKTGRRRARPQMKHSFVRRWRGEDREDRLKKMLLHTWEWVWFPVHSCTTSAQLWGRPARPPSGSFHLYPPDKLVLVSLQKLWKDKMNTKIEFPFWPDIKTNMYLLHIATLQLYQRSTSKIWLTQIYLRFSSPLLGSSSSSAADPSDLWCRT